jgi:uncharacterized delta-60 repeat protein
MKRMGYLASSVESRGAVQWFYCACAMFTLVAGSAHALTGDLDLDYGIQGRVLYSSNGDTGGVRSALQFDGKVVTAASCPSATTYNLCLKRTRIDGTPDTMLGNGEVVTSLAGVGIFVSGIAIQADTKIVVAASCVANTVVNVCVFRYLADGTLDTTFRGTGYVISTNGNLIDAQSVALQDSRIVVVARCLNGASIRFCYERFTANGNLDTGFGANGRITLTAGVGTQNGDQSHAGAIQPDGKLILVGQCAQNNKSNFCMARFTLNGALDLQFGIDGTVINSVSAGANQLYAIAVQPDGKIVVGGSCGALMCVARYNSNGSFDIAFNNTGFHITTYEGAVSSLVVQADEKVVALGTCLRTTYDFCTIRLQPDGARDDSFYGGIVYTSVSSGRDYTSSLLIQTDGKLVAAGTCDYSSATAVCLVRYQNDRPSVPACQADVDGDGNATATIDGLILTRVMLGVTGNAVLNGINFPAAAIRRTWGDDTPSDIRKYLLWQCGMKIVS